MHQTEKQRYIEHAIIKEKESEIKELEVDLQLLQNSVNEVLKLFQDAEKTADGLKRDQEF